MILELFQRLKWFYFSFRRGYIWNKHWNNFKIISKIDSLRWSFQRRMPHFWGAHPGGYDPYIRTRLTPKFHHLMFTRSEIIMLTNKQTNRRR